jgi:PhoPQ-activated pathogenicity-related protein
LNLVERRTNKKRRRSWVDPYSFRDRYKVPKLLLLGTNDPYWVVDSLRHYWNDLPGPKLVFQTPNAGHDLGGGKEAIQTLAAFFQMIADRQELPVLTWQFNPETEGKADFSLRVNQPARKIRLWTADSEVRDMRRAKWTSRDLEISPAAARPRLKYRGGMRAIALTSAKWC